MTTYTGAVRPHKRAYMLCYPIQGACMTMVAQANYVNQQGTRLRAVFGEHTRDTLIVPEHRRAPSMLHAHAIK